MLYTNKNTPEVPPNDSWEDSDVLPAVVLPPRRKVGDKAEPYLHSAAEPVRGLRIESRIDSRAEKSAGAATRLEVKELGGSVLRLDMSEMVSAPKKIPRQEQAFAARAPRKALAKTGEGRDWGLAQRHRLPGVLGAGAVICAAAVVYGMVMLPKINALNLVRADSTRPVLVVETETEIKGMDQLNALVARRGEALEIFRSFVLASQVEEVIPLVLHGVALTETLREHWQARKVPADWKPDASSSWTIVEASSLPYVLLRGDLPDHTPFAAYFTREGQRLALDWKATTAFGSASFGALETGGGDPAEIRGVISTTDFYSAIWPEDEYQSFRLASPDEKITLWCYTRRNSEPDATLSSFLNRGEITAEAKAYQKVTLRLERGHDDAAPNQWLIGEVIQTDWLTPKPDSP